MNLTLNCDDLCDGKHQQDDRDKLNNHLEFRREAEAGSKETVGQQSAKNESIYKVQVPGFTVGRHGASRAPTGELDLKLLVTVNSFSFQRHGSRTTNFVGENAVHLRVSLVLLCLS